MPKGLIKIADNFNMDAMRYAVLKTAILGLPDSGKSYTALKIAEQLLEKNIPIVAFDPAGVWWSLKVGIKGNKGFPIVVAGGEHADISLTPAAAKDIMKAAMAENVSIVFDLSGEETATKSDWRKIVKDTVNELFYHNKQYGVRHIFLEEASEFIPQIVRGDIADVYSAIDKTIRIGRNKGLGITIINQRAAGINKEAHENCNMNILHNQEGRNSLKQIEDWFSVKREKGFKDIMESIPLLPKGEAWVIGNREQPVKIKVLPRSTFHPNPLETDVMPTGGKTANVKEFVGKLKDHLEKLHENIIQSENDKKANKEELRKLQQEITNLRNSVQTMGTEISEKNIEISRLKKYEENFRQILGHSMNFINSIEGIGRDSGVKALPITTVKEFSSVDRGGEITTGLSPQKYATQARGGRGKKSPAPTPAPVVRNPQGNGNLPPGEKAILTACIQFYEGVLRNQLTTLTGYKRSSRDAYIQRLISKGYVQNSGGKLYATKEGKALLGDSVQPLPIGAALRQYWLDKLPDGERTVLQILIDHYPKSINRDRIDELTDYKRSTRDAYLQRMAAKELVEIEGRGEVRASKNLF